MPLLESVRTVLWARRRRPEQTRYLLSLADERFSPGELLEQAVEAERAGFDGICGSDHLAPWWEPGPDAPAACGSPRRRSRRRFPALPTASDSDSSLDAAAALVAQLQRHLGGDWLSGDPRGMIRTYADEVLPELRG